MRTRLAIHRVPVRRTSIIRVRLAVALIAHPKKNLLVRPHARIFVELATTDQLVERLIGRNPQRAFVAGLLFLRSSNLNAIVALVNPNCEGYTDHRRGELHGVHVHALPTTRASEVDAPDEQPGAQPQLALQQLGVDAARVLDDSRFLLESYFNLLHQLTHVVHLSFSRSHHRQQSL